MVSRMCQENTVVWYIMIIVSTTFAEPMSDSKNPRNETCNKLNSFVKCYEEMHFNAVSHSIQEIMLTFDAFSNRFHMILNPDPLINQQNIGSSLKRVNVTIHEGKAVKRINYENKHVYKGFLKNNPNSTATGIYVKGIFSGIINTGNEVYFIEPKYRYFKTLIYNKYFKPMIIYKESSIIGLENLSLSKTKLAFDPKLFGETYKENVYGSWKLNYTHRHKRSATDSKNKMQYCEVRVVVDHTYFQNIGLWDYDITVSEIINHFAVSDKIFRSTDFNMDKYNDNIGFTISEIEIYTSENSDNYLMKDVNEDCDTILDHFCLYDHERFCLSVLFMHRDCQGVIGLAYLASSSPYGSPGGICQKRLTYRNQQVSLNTLLVTGLSFGNTLPRQVTSLTVVHEFGHSFGSPHDSGQCAPGGRVGNYIMFPSASNADRPNNYLFSDCSVLSMWPVITNKGQQCFKELSGGGCGNQWVDEGEECDCGFTLQCSAVDHCCIPADDETNGCKINRTSGAVCSPKASGCCDSDCQIKPQGIKCREETECAESQICTGLDKECPPSNPYPNDKLCNGGTKYCFDGECSKSICEGHNMTQCQCTLEKANMCQLCCECNNCEPSDNGGFPCVSAFALGITHQNGSIINLEIGHSCNNYKGYCNEDNSCVSYNALDRLKEFLEEYVLVKLIIDNWYFVLLFCNSITVAVAIYKIKQDRKKHRNLSGAKNKKLSALQYSAKNTIDVLNTQLNKFTKLHTNRLEELNYQSQMDDVIAIGRLQTFFPMVNRREIEFVVQSSENEEQALSILVQRGHHMRKLCEENTY